MPHLRRLVAAFMLLAAVPVMTQAAPDSWSSPPRFVATPPAAMAAVANASPASSVLTLEAGGGRVVRLPGPAASVFAADPKVAEARPASATSLFIFGVAPGRTTIAALDAAGAMLAQYRRRRPPLGIRCHRGTRDPYPPDAGYQPAGGHTSGRAVRIGRDGDRRRGGACDFGRAGLCRAQPVGG